MVAALALGLVPFLAGCFAQSIDRSAVAADAGVAYVGDPVPVRIVVRAARVARDRDPSEVPPPVPWLVTHSLANVLRSTRLFASVSVAGESSAAATVAGPVGPLVRLEPEVLDFDLYQNYGWWGLYALGFAIPVIGTSAIVILVFLAGAPILSDHGVLAIRVRAVDDASGRVLGTYDGTERLFQGHNIWNAGEHLESFLYHPVALFQGACAAVVRKLVQDRWTYLRLAGRPT